MPTAMSLLTQGSGRQRIENSFGNVEVNTIDGDLTVISAKRMGARD